MKTILLCRVSTKDQEISGYSLAAQKKMLTQYAQAKSYTIERVFRVAETASKHQVRKVFKEMLTFIEKNAVDIICCEKTDRLLRNGKDATRIDDWLAEKETRAVHFVKENFVLRGNTPAHERFIWDVKVAAASYYTNNLSEEVRKGQKEKLSQGWLPARPKIGYITVGEKGHKTQIIDSTKGSLARLAFELYATGNYSLTAVTEKMYVLGLRNWKNKKVTKARMYSLLSSPYYHGKILWHGQLYKGNHEPLIPKSLFDAVQTRLQRKMKQPRYRKHLPTFKGKIRCEGCQGTITWELQKGNWYGHCNGYKDCALRKFWRQEHVESLLSPFFQKIAPKSNVVLAIVESACKLSNDVKIEENVNAVPDFQKSVDIANKRLEAIYEDKIDGKISVEFYEKKKLQYEAELSEAEAQLEKNGAIDPRYYQVGYALHELATHAEEIYTSPKATVQDQRLLLSKIFSNLELNAENIKPEYTLAYEFMAFWVPQLNDTFEPKNIHTLQSQNSDSDPSCLLLRAYRDDFRTFAWEKAICDITQYFEDIQYLLSLVA